MNKNNRILLLNEEIEFLLEIVQKNPKNCILFFQYFFSEKCHKTSYMYSRIPYLYQEVLMVINCCQKNFGGDADIMHSFIALFRFLHFVDCGFLANFRSKGWLPKFVAKLQKNGGFQHHDKTKCHNFWLAGTFYLKSRYVVGPYRSYPGLPVLLRICTVCAHMRHT